jgi:hypothetical protein
VAAGGSIRGPLIIGSTAGLQTFFNWGRTIEDMTVDGAGNIVLIDNAANIAVVSTETFEIIREVAITGVPTNPSWRQRIAYDRFNDRYYLQSYNNGSHYILNSDFEVVESLGGFTGSPDISRGRDVYRNQLYISPGAQSAQLYTAKVWDQYDTSPRIEAVRPFCGLNNALLKRTDPIVLTAAITAREVATGIQIEGELIKAALEYYYRAKVPDDYLDHIYGFDVSRDKNGFPFKKLVSGNRTFKAAQIVDNLSTLAPSRVTVILDNEMKLGANL